MVWQQGELLGAGGWMHHFSLLICFMPLSSSSSQPTGEVCDQAVGVSSGSYGRTAPGWLLWAVGSQQSTLGRDQGGSFPWWRKALTPVCSDLTATPCSYKFRHCGMSFQIFKVRVDDAIWALEGHPDTAGGTQARDHYYTPLFNL